MISRYCRHMSALAESVAAARSRSHLNSGIKRQIQSTNMTIDINM